MEIIRSKRASSASGFITGQQKTKYKKRSVSPLSLCLTDLLKVTSCREPLPPKNVTCVTSVRHPSGGEARMVQEPCVMPAGCVSPVSPLTSGDA